MITVRKSLHARPRNLRQAGGVSREQIQMGHGPSFRRDEALWASCACVIRYAGVGAGLLGEAHWVTSGAPVRTDVTTSSMARTEVCEPRCPSSRAACVAWARRWLVLLDSDASRSWAMAQ